MTIRAMALDPYSRRFMARLMIVPIRKRGDSVLILSCHAETELIGFVAQTTLAQVLHHKPPMHECMSLVQRHLKEIEPILLRKSQSVDRHGDSGAEITPCVEITTADLTQQNIDFTRT
jgi:hypothetical protein